MVEECYDIHEPELSLKEQRKFWAKTIAFCVQRYGTGLAAELNSDDSKFNLAVKEHLKDSRGELRTALRDIEINIDGEEIDELLGELGNDLEKLGKKWGKKLEGLLEKKK